MKLLRSDGAEMIVRDVGPVLMTVRRRSGGPPIKLNGTFVLEDAAARETLKEIMVTGWYDWEKTP